MATSKTKDVYDLVDSFEETHDDLLRRMDSDYDLYLLKPYELELASGTAPFGESCNVTSNEPRIMADKIIQLLEEAKMQIKITTPKQDRDKENLVERLLYGLFNMADKNLRRRQIISGRTVQSALVFYGAIFGFMIGRIILTKVDKKTIRPSIVPVFPRSFSYGLDGEGMPWCATKTRRDPETIWAEYEIDVTEDKDVIDYWDDNNNYIVVGDETIPQKHKLGRVPFVFVPVGSSPVIFSEWSQYDNISSFGESVYAADRSLFELESKTLTIWASLLEKSHKPSGFLSTDSNRLKIERLPWGTGELMPIGPNDKFIPITPPDIANSTPNFYNILHQMIQKGGLADIEHGLIAGAEYPSGKAITGLQEGKSAKLTPLLKAMSAFYEDASELLLEQYEKMGIKVDVKGVDSKGVNFYQEIDPKKVKKPWDIDIRFVAMSPEQEMANMAKAQVAQTIGLDQTYINEKILEMEDPIRPERLKLLKEAEVQYPIIKLLHQLEAAKHENKTKEADVLGKALMEQLNQIMHPSQPAQPQLPQAPQQPQPQPMMPQGGVPNG